MRSRQQCNFTRTIRFFLINLSHDNLVDFFKINYQLMQKHHYSLDDIEMMMPWEREIYLVLLEEDIKAERDRMQQMQMARK